MWSSVRVGGLRLDSVGFAPRLSGHGSSSSSNFRSRSDLSVSRLGRWLSHTINVGQVEPCLSLWLLTGWAVDWAVLSNYQIIITALTAEQGTTAQTQATLAAAQIQPDLLDPAWCYSKVTQKKTGPLQSLSFELWSFVFCARWCLALSGSTWDHTNGQTWNQHWLIDSSRILLPRSFQCWIFCQSFQQYEKTLKQSEHSWTALSTDCYSKDLESIKHARTCRVNWFLLSSTKGCRALLFCQWSFLLSWVTAWCEQWGPCLELVAAGLKIWGLIDGFSNWFNDKAGGQLCQARAVGASESNRSTMLKGMSFSSLWRISW